MTENQNMGEHERSVRQWAKAYGKAPPEAAIRQARYQDERARAEQAETKGAPASAEAVRHVGRFPSSYAIGATRSAMDGTQWKRIA